MTVVIDSGNYTCATCLCPIQGAALIDVDEDGLRTSYHLARCDILKPGEPARETIEPSAPDTPE